MAPRSPAARRLALGLLVALAGLAASPAAGGQSPDEGPLEDQLAAFREEVRDAVEAYRAAHANFTAAEDEQARERAREAMTSAGRDVGEAFLAFERGHGEEGSLSVFMQTEMPRGFYRDFEQDVVLLRADMVAAARGTPTPRDEVAERSSAVESALDRTGECLPDGCGSALAGAGAQSFLVLLREGFEAILVVGAIVAYLHKSDRADQVRHVYKGVAAALAASLLAWLALDQAASSAAARGGLASAIVEGLTMLLAAAVLFWVGFWLLNKVEAERWRSFLDGQVENSLADGNPWALGVVGFLAVGREGLETALFVQAIALGSGGPWLEIAIGLGLGALALAAVYYLVHRAGVTIPLRAFFGVTSALLLFLSLRFLGLGVFEFQEAGLLGVTQLPAWLAAWAQGPAGSTLGALAGFAPTAEVAIAQALLAGSVLAGLAWTFLIRPVRSRRSVGSEA